MNKLTAIRIKYDDGTYSDEIPVSVLSENVEWDNTHTLVDVLGSIDVDVTGTIQDQINQLFNEKGNSSEIVVLKSRIDNLIKLESGSTTGDAELADARITYDGLTKNNVGNAIRSQVLDLHENSAFCKSLNLLDKDSLGYGSYWGIVDGAVQLKENTDYCFTKIAIKPNTQYSCTYGYNIRIADINGENITAIGTGTSFLYNGELNEPYVYLAWNATLYPPETYMLVEGDRLPSEYIPYGRQATLLLDRYVNKKLTEKEEIVLDAISEVSQKVDVLKNGMSFTTGIKRKNVNMMDFAEIHDGDYIAGFTEGRPAIRSDNEMSYTIIDLPENKTCWLRFPHSNINAGVRFTLLDEDNIRTTAVMYSTSAPTFVVEDGNDWVLNVCSAVSRYGGTKIGFSFATSDEFYVYVTGGTLLKSEDSKFLGAIGVYPFISTADFVDGEYAYPSIRNAISDIRLFGQNIENPYISKIWMTSAGLDKVYAIKFSDKNGVVGTAYDLIVENGQQTVNIVDGNNVCVGKMDIDMSIIDASEALFSTATSSMNYEHFGISNRCICDSGFLPPEKFYTLADLEQSLYLKNMMIESIDNWVLKFPDGQSSKIADFDCRRITYNSTAQTTGVNQLPLQLVSKNGKDCINFSYNVYRAAKNAHSGETKKVLLLGDSLIANGFTAEALSELGNGDVMNVQVYGTHFGNNNTQQSLNEGFAGWCSYDVLHTSSYNQRTNPFLNNGVFDVSYYMEQNNIPEMDWVFIQIGVNDIFRPMNGTNTIDNIRSMIDSIKTAMPNVKIGICQPPQPYMGGNFSSHDFKPPYISHVFRLNIAKEELSVFGGRTSENIYLVPSYAVIDTDYNFKMSQRQVNACNPATELYCTDVTHYAESGHAQVARQIFCCMKYN